MNFTLSTSGEEGLTLLKQVKVFRPDVPVILMTAWGSIQLAVQGMQAGAFDFITKPWNNVALMQRIETALELNSQDKKAEVPVEDNDGFNRSHHQCVCADYGRKWNRQGVDSRSGAFEQSP